MHLLDWHSVSSTECLHCMSVWLSVCASHCPCTHFVFAQLTCFPFVCSHGCIPACHSHSTCLLCAFVLLSSVCVALHSSSKAGCLISYRHYPMYPIKLIHRICSQQLCKAATPQMLKIPLQMLYSPLRCCFLKRWARVCLSAELFLSQTSQHLSMCITSVTCIHEMCA